MARLFTLRKAALIAPALAAVMTLAACTTVTQQAAVPASCAAAVKQAQNSIWLRIQGGSDHQTAVREDAKVQLYIAGMAAAAGNEAECWQHYNVSTIGY
jgi:uncharacterized lipoprotein YbaY